MLDEVSPDMFKGGVKAVRAACPAGATAMSSYKRAGEKGAAIVVRRRRVVRQLRQHGAEADRADGAAMPKPPVEGATATVSGILAKKRTRRMRSW